MMAMGLKREMTAELPLEGAASGLHRKSELEMFNSKERSIVEIWDGVEYRLPMTVAAYDMADGAAVLVTRFEDGFACGFPLWNGERTTTSWYGESDRGSIRVPEGGMRKWRLVGLPFDDMEKVLFRHNFSTQKEEEEVCGEEADKDVKVGKVIIRKTGATRGKNVVRTEIPPVVRTKKNNPTTGVVAMTTVVAAAEETKQDEDNPKQRAKDIMLRARQRRFEEKK